MEKSHPKKQMKKKKSVKEKSSKYLTGAFAILCNGILKDQHQSCTATYIAATPNIHISANPDVRQNVQLPKL